MNKCIRCGSSRIAYIDGKVSDISRVDPTREMCLGVDPLSRLMATELCIGVNYKVSFRQQT